MKKRVADIVIETLLEYGIDTCFGVVGGGAMFLDDALRLCDGMKKIFNHHEQASAMAAEAYARYCGKPALCCVTCGPGATNAMTGVMGAWQDSIPMIVVSGQVRYAISVPQSGLNLRYRGIQEYQVIPAAKAMTKYATTITDPLSIKRELVKAYNVSMDGRRGPVWIEVPQDMQSAVVETEELYPIEEYISEVPKPSRHQMEAVLKKLTEAKRPCVISGSGLRSGGAMDLFYSFIDKLGIPFVGEAWVADSGYHEHPLFFGMSGNIGPRAGNFILQNADVILSLGCSLGYRETGFNLEGFAPDARIMMVDACEAEGKKPGLRIDQFIHADVKDFLCMANNEFDCLGEWREKKELTPWLDYCDSLKKRFSRFEGAEGKSIDNSVCSYVFWREFERFENDDTVWALGNNTACSSKLQTGINKRNQRVLTNYTCGSMGYDLPAAIGAAMASGKRIYCVTGDGSIMMNLQELQTIRHYDLPVSVVVFNNDGYNAIRQTAKSFFEGQYIGCSPETGVSFPFFEDVARTFGFEYRVCKTNGDLQDSIKWMTKSKSRVFLEIIESFDDPVVPKVMSRMNESGQMQTPVLQDMSPFLDKTEYNKWMIGGN